jgi:hypothetical protein
MVEAWGIRVFFELKDREFGLGDAYAFASRVARYQGSRGVVVSTDRIAEEAQRFLNEQRASTRIRVNCLSGSEALPDAIHSLVAKLARRHVWSGLFAISSSLGIDVAQLLKARLPGLIWSDDETEEDMEEEF